MKNLIAICFMVFSSMTFAQEEVVIEQVTGVNFSGDFVFQWTPDNIENPDGVFVYEDNGILNVWTLDDLSYVDVNDHVTVEIVDFMPGVALKGYVTTNVPFGMGYILYVNVYEFENIE